MTIRKKNSTIYQKMMELSQFLSAGPIFQLGHFPTYRALVFWVEKDFALKLGGHRESWVVIFGRGPASEGQNGGTP